MKVKICRYCGKEQTDEDPISRRQCINCSMKRMRRWLELQYEAKIKFDQEWPAKYG